MNVQGGEAMVRSQLQDNGCANGNQLKKGQRALTMDRLWTRMKGPHMSRNYDTYLYSAVVEID